MASKYDFVSIDFETANSRYDSACSIGLAAVRDMAVVDTFYSLINYDGNFLPANISIHGIHPEDVISAPTIFELYPTLLNFFDGCLVIAHNARFDMSVLKSSLGGWYSLPNFKYVDSVALTKGVFPGKKNLQSCVNCLGITLEHHHNALDDAIACARVAIECTRRAGYSDFLHFCIERENIKIHNISDLAISHFSAFSSSSHSHSKFQTVSVKELSPVTKEFDPSHPLYQKKIVFTGELSISRAEAMQQAIDVGAIIRTSVSTKTDFLVVGQQDSELVGVDGKSSKEEKAQELISSGKGKIQILNEAEFLSMLNYKQEEVNNEQPDYSGRV